jgi:EAL and modified HD-GYP domain-containing signal transduction protein
MYFYAARQPILDADKKLFAYEVLFRDGVDNVFPDIDEDEATTRLVEGAQINFGLEDLTDNKPAFINFTLETILKRYPAMMSSDTLVVEVLETVQPGKTLLAAIKELNEQGYVVALDDYEHKPVWRHFYPFIKLIKFDLRAMSLDEIASIVEELKEFPHIELLAEKVETLEEFEQCKALGFKYFQGYFFSYPEVVKAKSLSPAQMTLAELLYETSAQELDLPKITQIFERDINLAYKLLRYSNSAIFKRRAEISTIKQALVVLGQYELKKFLSLLFAAQVNSSKPEELLKMAMIRARFCEDLAQAEGSQDQGMAFLTGMMSLIDAILDDQIEKIMEQLPLAAEIKAALIHGEGKLAEYLALAKAYERGSWDDVEQIRDSLELTVQQAPSFYNDSIQWATEQMRALES